MLRFRCLLEGEDGNRIVTKTSAVQFKEHFGLAYGSHYIICKIPQMQPGSYNWTKVTVIKQDPSMEDDVVNKRKAFPGKRKRFFISHFEDIDSWDFHFRTCNWHQQDPTPRCQPSSQKTKENGCLHQAISLQLEPRLMAYRILRVSQSPRCLSLCVLQPHSGTCCWFGKLCVYSPWKEEYYIQLCNQVIQRYVNTGEATVLEWNLPLKTQKQIRTEGMFTALNECNLRLVNRFEFTLMVDVDEFILPYGNVTDLFQMIDGITGSPKMGAFVFKNAFHYLYWSNDTSTTEKYARGLFDQYDVKKINDTSSIVQPYLLTQTKTRRLVNLHNHGTRSKYIVRPDAADMIGNHNVWTFFPGSILLTHKFYKYHWKIKITFQVLLPKT